MGVGVNNYREYAKLHAQDQFILVDDNEIMFLDFPENGYLKIMVEFGLFAALILLFLLIGPIISLFNNYFKGRQVVLGLFFFAPVVAWFVSMSTVYNLGDSKLVVVLASYIVAMLGIATYPQLQKTTYE